MGRRFSRVLLVAIGLALSGCSIIGTTIGSQIDLKERRYVGPEELGRLKPGTFVRLELTDSTVVSGNIIRFTPAESVGVAVRPAELEVRTNDTVIPASVPLASVRRIGFNSGMSYANAGLALGLAADILIFILVEARSPQ
jgi:hypothetical protein